MYGTTTKSSNCWEISAEIKASTRVVAIERLRQPGAQKDIKTDASWLLYNLQTINKLQTYL